MIVWMFRYVWSVTAELIGEGFRLNDLRRYGEGFTRDNSVAVPNFPLDNLQYPLFRTGSFGPELHPR